MAGEETRAAEKRMASHLARKQKRAHSEMCGYVRARMAIAIVRSNALLLRGPRNQRGRRAKPQWEDSAGFACCHQWGGEP